MSPKPQDGERVMRRKVSGVIAAAVTLASVAATLLIASAADAAELYDQSAPVETPTNAITSQVYTDQPDLTSQAADDFTVPVAQFWELSEVDVIGDNNSAAPMNVFIYRDLSGLPGEQVFAQLGIPAPGGPNYAIPITNAPSLAPGTYWISVQAVAPTNEQWFWANRGVRSGNEAAWRNPGGGFMSGCLNWGPKGNCPVGGDGSDQLFKLQGAVVPPPATRDPATNLKKKCKKKHRAKARKRCRKRAKKLPI
jgi:hypothetical protein